MGHSKRDRSPHRAPPRAPVGWSAPACRSTWRTGCVSKLRPRTSLAGTQFSTRLPTTATDHVRWSPASLSSARSGSWPRPSGTSRCPDSTKPHTPSHGLAAVDRVQGFETLQEEILPRPVGAGTDGAPLRRLAVSPVTRPPSQRVAGAACGSDRPGGHPPSDQRRYRPEHRHSTECCWGSGAGCDRGSCPPPQGGGLVPAVSAWAGPGRVPVAADPVASSAGGAGRAPPGPGPTRLDRGGPGSGPGRLPG